MCDVGNSADGGTSVVDAFGDHGGEAVVDSFHRGLCVAWKVDGHGLVGLIC